MATAGIAAKTGTLYCTTANSSAGTLHEVLEVMNLSLNVQREDIDATSNDSSGWTETLGGVASFTVAVTGVHNNNTTGQEDAIRAALVDDVGRYFMFMPSTGGGYNWRAFGRVSDWNIGGGTHDKFELTATISGNGALTESTST